MPKSEEMSFSLANLPFSWGQRDHPTTVRLKGLTPPPVTADRGGVEPFDETRRTGQPLRCGLVRERNPTIVC
jgi:hypothetical protein